MLDEDQAAQLDLLIQEAKRVRRHANVVVQMAAQLKESTAAETSTAEEAHEDGSDTD